MNKKYKNIIIVVLIFSVCLGDKLIKIIINILKTIYNELKLPFIFIKKPFFDQNQNVIKKHKI